jgi:hypothetical protein
LLKGERTYFWTCRGDFSPALVCEILVLRILV